MRRHQVHVAVDPEALVHLALQLLDQGLPGRAFGKAAFHHQHDDLLFIFGFDIEGGGFAHPDLVHFFGYLFQVLGPDVPAVHDDDVLAASGQVEVVAVHVAQVAGIQPAVFQYHPVGCFLVVQVAAHQAGSFYQHPADAHVGQQFAFTIDNPYLVLGQGASAIYYFVYLAVVRLHAHGDAAFGHGQRIDRHHVQAAVEFRKRRGKRCFRQPVTGQEGAGIKTGLRHGLGKGLESAGTQHLCADTGYAPAAQVELLQVGAANSARAQFVTERRRERDGATVAADQAQPLQWADGKIPCAQVIHR